MTNFEFNRPTVQQWFNLLSVAEKEIYLQRLKDRNLSYLLDLAANNEVSAVIFINLIDYKYSEFSSFLDKASQFYKDNLTVRNAI